MEKSKLLRQDSVVASTPRKRKADKLREFTAVEALEILKVKDFSGEAPKPDACKGCEIISLKKEEDPAISKTEAAPAKAEDVPA